MPPNKTRTKMYAVKKARIIISEGVKDKVREEEERKRKKDVLKVK